MILKRKKVILRPIKIDDLPRFVKWLRDEETRKFLSANPKPTTLKEEKEWLKGLAKNKKVERQFAIDTKSGVHIGSISLHSISLKHRNAEFGILIGDKNYWSKGYGNEATKIILDYGFNKLKLHRIGLSVYDYNNRAIKLYKKLNFKTEGTIKEAVFWKGKFYDVIRMGILQKEWRKNKI